MNTCQGELTPWEDSLANGLKTDEMCQVISLLPSNIIEIYRYICVSPHVSLELQISTKTILFNSSINSYMELL